MAEVFVELKQAIQNINILLPRDSIDICKEKKKHQAIKRDN